MGATQRWEILRQHVEDGIPLTALAVEHGIGVRTLQRWHAAYKGGGYEALNPKPPQRMRRIPPEMVRLIEGLAPSLGYSYVETSPSTHAERSACVRTDRREIVDSWDGERTVSVGPERVELSRRPDHGAKRRTTACSSNPSRR